VRELGLKEAIRQSLESQMIGTRFQLTRYHPVGWSIASNLSALVRTTRILGAIVKVVEMIACCRKVFGVERKDAID
jgi:hypothetical protein